MPQGIKFQYADRKLLNIKTKVIKHWIIITMLAEKMDSFEFTYIFCSDDYLLEINKQFLQHDYYTDIITFDLSEKDRATIVSELYISVDRVKENAITNNTNWQKELARVIIHGALHLCGYGDKTKKEIEVMRSKEDFYLNQLFEF